MTGVIPAISKRLRGLLNVLLPPLEARPANRKMLKQLEQEQASIGASDARYQSWFRLPYDTLDRLLKEENGRATALEEKSAKIIAVLGIGLTIGGVVGKNLADGISTHWFKSVVVVELVVSMLYLLWGGWIAFNSGLSAKPRMGIGADWAVKLLDGAKTDSIRALIHFEKMNIIRNNDLSVAVSCVRNGLVVFAVAVLMTLVDPLVAMPRSTSAHGAADPVGRASMQVNHTPNGSGNAARPPTGTRTIEPYK